MKGFFIQISRIGNTNFGYGNQGYFDTLGTDNKLIELNNKLVQAHKERRILAQNQAKIFEMMKIGFNTLATHGDNYHVCSGMMKDTFNDAKLEKL